MGGPVELVEAPNCAIVNKHLLDNIGSGGMVSDAEGRPRIGLGMDEGIPGKRMVSTIFPISTQTAKSLLNKEICSQNLLG